MNMTKGTRIILLSIAALLIAGALLLNASITENHPYSGAAKTLREYGYTLDDDDFYNVGSFPDSTIQDILAGSERSSGRKRCRRLPVGYKRQGGYNAAAAHS